MNPKNKTFTKLLLFLFALALSGRAALQASTTFTVTNTSAAGAGSLVDAINSANNTAGLDTIAFNIPSSDPGCHNVPGVGTVCTIQPGNMPAITDSLTIDGYTQPGSSQNTLTVGDDAKVLIELDGTGAISSGIYVIVDTVTIRGLIINRFGDQSIIPDRGNGVFIDATGTVVEGCFIGSDPTGTVALPNGKDAVSFHGLVAGLGARVGGASPGQRNILSGNKGNGIAVVQQAGGVQVLGNYIGTDRNGTAAVPNAGGIYIDRNGAPNQNRIGGPSAGERNVISGNFYPTTDAGYGIQFGLGDCDDVIQGNYIGLGADGITALGNSADGVFTTPFKNSTSPNDTIGGSNPGEGNVISSNGRFGVHVGAFSPNHTIQGNLIGTAADGITPRGNAQGGIYTEGCCSAIGGTTPGAGNVVAFNGKDGVAIPASFSYNNDSISILGNSIHDNGNETNDLGIDILDAGGGLDGPTANDHCDLDTGSGGNELQNYPVLSSAIVSGGMTTIQGTLDSISDTTYRIEFFANAACDASGYGEGERYLGSIDVTTDSNCSASINAVVAATSPGEMITATATDPANNTSEFSACLAVQPSATLTVSPTRVREGQSATYTIALGDTAPQNTRVNFAISGTATLGTDYTLTGAQLSGNRGRVTIRAGQSSATVTLNAVSDGMTESAETAIMTISSGSGYAIGNPKKATVRISDP